MRKISISIHYSPSPLFTVFKVYCTNENSQENQKSSSQNAACTHFYSPKTFSYYKVNVNDISVTDQNDCEHWSKLVLVMFLSIWRLKQILSLWLTRIHDAAVSEQTTAMISLSLLRDNVSSILSDSAVCEIMYKIPQPIVIAAPVMWTPSRFVSCKMLFNSM